MSSDWVTVVGVDFGIIDSNAIAVLKFRHHDPCVYVDSCWKLKAGPTEMAIELADVMRKHAPQQVVADCGGMGKSFQYEMQTRFHLPIQAAEKHAKVAYIGLMNDAFRQGKLLLVRERCKGLIGELVTLPWAHPLDSRRETTQQEAPGYENHACDSLLYAWRACLAFLETPKRPDVVENTREFWQRKMLDEEDAALAEPIAEWPPGA